MALSGFNHRTGEWHLNICLFICMNSFCYKSYRILELHYERESVQAFRRPSVLGLGSSPSWLPGASASTGNNKHAVKLHTPMGFFPLLINNVDAFLFPQLKGGSERAEVFSTPFGWFSSLWSKATLELETFFGDLKLWPSRVGNVFLSALPHPIWYIIGLLKISVEFHAKEYLSSCQHLVINTNVVQEKKIKSPENAVDIIWVLKPQGHQSLSWCCCEMLPKQFHFTLSSESAVTGTAFQLREIQRCHWRNLSLKTQKAIS